MCIVSAPKVQGGGRLIPRHDAGGHLEAAVTHAGVTLAQAGCHIGVLAQRAVRLDSGGGGGSGGGRGG